VLPVDCEQPGSAGIGEANCLGIRCEKRRAIRGGIYMIHRRDHIAPTGRARDACELETMLCKLQIHLHTQMEDAQGARAIQKKGIYMQ